MHFFFYYTIQLRKLGETHAYHAKLVSRQLSGEKKSAMAEESRDHCCWKLRTLPRAGSGAGPAIATRQTDAHYRPWTLQCVPTTGLSWVTQVFNTTDICSNSLWHYGEDVLFGLFFSSLQMKWSRQVKKVQLLVPSCFVRCTGKVLKEQTTSTTRKKHSNASWGWLIVLVFP